MCQKAFGSFFAPLIGAMEKFELTRGEAVDLQKLRPNGARLLQECGTRLTSTMSFAADRRFDRLARRAGEGRA